MCDGEEGRVVQGKAGQDREWHRAGRDRAGLVRTGQGWAGRAGRAGKSRAEQGMATYGAGRDRIRRNRVWQGVM